MFCTHRNVNALLVELTVYFIAFGNGFLHPLDLSFFRQMNISLQCLVGLVDPQALLYVLFLK